MTKSYGDNVRGVAGLNWAQRPGSTLPDHRTQQYAHVVKVPNGYCPIHATGVKLPDDFVVTPLQYVD
jgi:hypothetical protein